MALKDKKAGVAEAEYGYTLLKKERSLRKRVLILSLIVLSVIFASVIIYLSVSSTENRLENTRQFIRGEEAKIQNAITTRISTAKALGMYVISKKGEVSDFADIAADLIDDDPALMSIQLAPNGVVKEKYIYPKIENFGEHDLFADPDRREDAEYARDSGNIAVSGPLSLRQGGIGIIIRNPIYLADEHGEQQFWGFSMVVLDMSEVFSTANLELLSDQSYNYRLWRYEPKSDDKVQIIAANTEDEITNAIREEITVYNSVWYLDIAPQGRWVPRVTLICEIAVFTVIMWLTLAAINSHLKVREVLYYDRLLNIGNLNALYKTFDKLCKQSNDRLYLVTFDVDKFKEFNYIYGEEAGDNLLRYLVRVLHEISPTAHLFRVASDIFVTADYCDSDADYATRIEYVLGRYKKDISDGVIQPFEISAGVRVVNREDGLQTVLSDALIAKGTIKDIPTLHYAFFDESTREKRIKYMSMEADFKQALANKEFKVYYQPKYNMVTGKIVGAEALVRWVKPNGEIISPGEFIPCFEQSRQIVRLDREVLETVCRQMKEMENEGIPVKRVSVNLSRVHIRQQEILPEVANIIIGTGVNPENLAFEITESVLYEDSIPLNQIIQFLHDLGCRVDMDDYGIGVSSLNALANNNFDMIKLDKSFIDGIGDRRTETVIKSTIMLASELGMKIIAEGVEEKHQIKHLVEWGCTFAQGFFYSKPVPYEEYKNLMRELMQSV